MATKLRVEKFPTDAEDWDDAALMEEDDEINKARRRSVYNGKRRKQIEDALEERRLMRQITYDFDDISDMDDSRPY